VSVNVFSTVFAGCLRGSCRKVDKDGKQSIVYVWQCHLGDRRRIKVVRPQSIRSIVWYRVEPNNATKLDVAIGSRGIGGEMTRLKLMSYKRFCRTIFVVQSCCSTNHVTHTFLGNMDASIGDEAEVAT